MIIVTGAAGFIGSCLTTKLNNKGIKEIILVDDFSNVVKNKNLGNKSFLEKVDRGIFLEWLKVHHEKVDFICHIGARTDTTEMNMVIFDELNLNYSKGIWKACTEYSIPLVYASSAATYGDGTLGYSDDPSIIPRLKPLNPYGISKNEFDKWVLLQKEQPPYWYGLKFFNVYGPNEYHKGRMASVVYHAFLQASSQKPVASNQKPVARSQKPLASSQKPVASNVTLFRSHNPAFKDGEQLRDFIYVKDVVDVIFYLMNLKANSGIYNLGTGEARTFLDLVNAVFSALNKTPLIQFIDTPLDIRDKYQYFTEADMRKLRTAGYARPFHSLEAGIEEYIQGYLIDGNYF